MNDNLIQRISRFIFGIKYYSVVSNSIGTPRCYVHGIYKSRKEAQQLLNEVSASLCKVEIISWRSHNRYTKQEDKYGTFWTCDN